MFQKFKRNCYFNDPCPWCWKIGLTVSVMKKSVIKFCFHRCGYKAPIPKKLLTFKERVKYYDPKRYQRQFSFVI